MVYWGLLIDRGLLAVTSYFFSLQGELDSLNNASDAINKLETELEVCIMRVTRGLTDSRQKA